MTTVGDESPAVRKRKRGRLRAWARGVWRLAKRDGAVFVDRFMMIVTVGGRRESPVLACETLKPLIDAGTDEGLWPDDDPKHRVMTVYRRDPRPLPGGRALIMIWVVPLGCGVNPLARLLSCAPGARGLMLNATIPDGLWLTSNMRETPEVRQRRQTGLMRLAEPLWPSGSVGSHAGVVCSVAYPDVRYYGDPDNTAETATALYGAGVALGCVPAVPQVFAFMLNREQCEPHSHGMRLLAFSCEPDLPWCTRLIEAERDA